jgi:hypothetical protein
VAAPFLVRLEDPGIDPQASESAFDWSGNRVEFAFHSSPPRIREQQDGGGLFSIASNGEPWATVTAVRRTGPSRQPVRWRMASGSGAVLTPGVEQKVGLSTRLRMSLWTFNAPFIEKLNGSNVVLDQPLLKLLHASRVDDLSLVYTITFDKSNPSQPRWADAFLPGGFSNLREPYLRALIKALHAIDVQVIVGYEIVEKDKDRTDLGDSFTGWLASGSPQQIEDYANSIEAFFADRGLGIDGIGFDFEINSLGSKQADNLALLYQKTSEAMAHRNGIVSYANAPFQEDGVTTLAFMKVQPFALARRAPNILARPMCFGSKRSASFRDVESSIACALRRSKKGGELHPSQVQFALWADRIGVSEMERWCRDLLRPNRIGLMLYNLPPARGAAQTFLQNCVKFDRALNPGEAPPGRDGQPLHVPRFGPLPPTTNIKPPRE